MKNKERQGLNKKELSYLEMLLDEADHDQSDPAVVVIVAGIYKKLFNRSYSCEE